MQQREITRSSDLAQQAVMRQRQRPEMMDTNSDTEPYDKQRSEEEALPSAEPVRQ